jgi:hypothetical protein
MYTAQGDFVCNKESNKESNKDIIENFAALPGGTYKQTCKNCSYQDNVLDCECKNKQGKYLSAKRYCKKTNIENSDGILLCK